MKTVFKTEVLFITVAYLDNANSHIFRWFQKSAQFLNAAKVLQEVQMEPLAFQYVGKKSIDLKPSLLKIYIFSLRDYCF